MLQAFGVSAGVALAGCGGGGGESTSTETDGGGDDGLPSQSEAVEEWGQRINEHAQQSGINWQQFEGTSLILGMNVHPFTSVTEPLLPYFEELTGISVTYNAFPEDQLWQKLDRKSVV